MGPKSEKPLFFSGPSPFFYQEEEKLVSLPRHSNQLKAWGSKKTSLSPSPCGEAYYLSGTSVRSLHDNYLSPYWSKRNAWLRLRMSICVYPFSETLLYQGAKDRFPFSPIAKEKRAHTFPSEYSHFLRPLSYLKIMIDSILNITYASLSIRPFCSERIHTATII